MNIVNKNPDMVLFEKLSCGSVFRDKHSNICMKTELNENTNMVYLTDGSLDYLDDTEKVERVRCELLVEN
jgi:hypothetical protein